MYPVKRDHGDILQNVYEISVPNCIEQLERRGFVPRDF